MKKGTRIVLACLIAAVTAVFAGCGSNQTAPEADKKPATRVVKHLMGEVTIPAEPKRIADVSGAAEELLILGHKPIATANTYKTKVMPHLTDKLPEVKPVGWMWDDSINMEAVIEAKPDLIIMNNRQQKLYEQMAKIAPTVVLETDMDKWRDKFKEIGRLFGQEEDVNKWLAGYDEKTKGMREHLKQAYGDQSFMFLAVTPKLFRVYGNYGYADILFTDLGLKPAEGTPADKTMEMIELEGLTKFQPDHLFLVNFGGKADEVYAELKKSPVWKSNKAVQQNHLYEVTNETFNTKAFGPLGKEMLLDEIGGMLLKKQ
ncbi:ferrichrome ABC transporter substrate-binding protein [Brevibacillus parabrevis]|uniref:ABC transporter substrate-binding protein n=1 Tax=Brevibacillus parabrevis TaxID=54914 RepID=UPI0007AC109C|nr:ABC transporter substrate-binding protein [Brevibacillus parabrevis]KZE47111.1 ferrichrome ABC transporter substrate-binding protein [Brevibacillus parabrevis]